MKTGLTVLGLLAVLLILLSNLPGRVTVGQAATRLATGNYTGNGTDDRAITGLGFQPDVVIVKGDVAETAVMRTSTMAGDASKPLVGPTSLVSVRSWGLRGFPFLLLVKTIKSLQI